MNLACYLRRSSQRQEDSIATQRRLLTEWAEQAGHCIVAWYEEEAISGSVSVADRPQAAALFYAVQEKRRPFDGILVLRADRLFRDLYDQLGAFRVLEKHHCPLFTPDGPVAFSTPETEFMTTVMGAAAQLERKLLGRRLHEHNLARAMQGKLPSGYPSLGLKYDRTTQAIAVDPDRLPDALLIFRTYRDTNGNSSETARTLNRLGVRTARGNLFTETKVLKILKAPNYRRQLRYSGRIVDAPDLIPETIPPDLLQAVDRLLTRGQTIGRRSKAVDLHPYAGLLVCGYCGQRMVINTSKDGYSKSYLGFYCMGRRYGLCESTKISVRLLDPLVGEALQRLLDGLGMPPEPATATSPIGATDRRRDRLQRQREKWARLYTEEVIGWEAMQREIARIDADLAALETPATPDRLTAADIIRWRETLAAGWTAAPPQHRRALLLALGAEIAVFSKPGDHRAIELLTTLDAPLIRTQSPRPYRKNTRGN